MARGVSCQGGISHGAGCAIALGEGRFTGDGRAIGIGYHHLEQAKRGIGGIEFAIVI